MSGRVVYDEELCYLWATSAWAGAKAIPLLARKALKVALVSSEESEAARRECGVIISELEAQSRWPTFEYVLDWHFRCWK